MRIRITHETVYRYETPAKSAMQIVRLTPRNHDGQYRRALAHRRRATAASNRTKMPSAISRTASPSTAR